MTFDYSCITFADGVSGYINSLPYLEHIESYDRTWGEITTCIIREAEFFQYAARFHSGFGKMPRCRLVYSNGTATSECNLHCKVAIYRGSFYLGDAIIGDVKYRYWLAIAILSKNTSHADLPADEP